MILIKPKNQQKRFQSPHLLDFKYKEIEKKKILAEVIGHIYSSENKSGKNCSTFLLLGWISIWTYKVIIWKCQSPCETTT